MTYDQLSGILTFYVGGQQVGQWNVGSHNPDTGKDLYIGRRPPSNYFSGLMDNVKIYNRALSTTEVMVLYNERPPTVTTTAASAVTATAATLNGIVKDNGNSTTVTFQYGPTADYEATVSGGTVLTGTGPSAVSAPITGLTCDTTYHYRVVAQNSTGTTNSDDTTFTTSACSLTVTVTGAGSGTVTSVPSGIACTAGSCTSNFSGTVTLHATPSALSLFGAWSGGICSGSAAECSVVMNNNKGVIATFNRVPLLQVDGTPYASLQAAYNAVAGGAVIQLLESTLTGTLTANRAVSVKLKGGYNTGYSATPGETAIAGPLRIRQGRVAADKVTVR